MFFCASTFLCVYGFNPVARPLPGVPPQMLGGTTGLQYHEL
jgi:hypothetical protein